MTDAAMRPGRIPKRQAGPLHSLYMRVRCAPRHRDDLTLTLTLALTLTLTLTLALTLP